MTQLTFGLVTVLQTFAPFFRVIRIRTSGAQADIAAQRGHVAQVCRGDCPDRFGKGRPALVDVFAILQVCKSGSGTPAARALAATAGSTAARGASPGAFGRGPRATSGAAGGEEPTPSSPASVARVCSSSSYRTNIASKPAAAAVAPSATIGVIPPSACGSLAAPPRMASSTPSAPLGANPGYRSGSCATSSAPDGQAQGKYARELKPSSARSALCRTEGIVHSTSTGSNLAWPSGPSSSKPSLVTKE